jgi:hypothetical protein
VNPIPFRQQTVKLSPPEGMSAAACGWLPVFRDGMHIISCWRPSWRERIALALGRPVWLWVWSTTTQPPVALTVESPFVDRGPEAGVGVAH